MIIAIDASSYELRRNAEDKITKRYNEEEDKNVKCSDNHVSLVTARNEFLHLKCPADPSQNQSNIHDITELQRPEHIKEHLYQSSLDTFVRRSIAYNAIFMSRPNGAIERGKSILGEVYNSGLLRRGKAHDEGKAEFVNARASAKLSAECDVSLMVNSGMGPKTFRRKIEPCSPFLIRTINNVSSCGRVDPRLCGKWPTALTQSVSYDMCFDNQESMQKQRGVIVEHPVKEHLTLNWSDNVSGYINNSHESGDHYLEQSQKCRRSDLSSIWGFHRLHTGLSKRKSSVNYGYQIVTSQSGARSPPCKRHGSPPYISVEECSLILNSFETSATHPMGISCYDNASEEILTGEIKDRQRHFLSTKSTVPYWNAYNKSKIGKTKNEATIIVDMGKTITCQNYLVELCKALMLYGVPTHRLEGCLITSSRVLGIQAQFLYLPGFMIICFEDTGTRTTNVQLVCIKHEIHLRKLCDVHEVYKDVIHCEMSVEDATSKLIRVKMQDSRYPKWVLLFAHGLASASVGPFAFKAQFSDLPICLILGLILGFLQLYVLPFSEPFAKMFEVAVAGITSFLARYIGSLQGGDRFCFSAMAQSSIALILPGYMVVCGSLELQSRFIVAGSVRIIYAIIYSMFLGYGMTIGIVTYGAFETNAVSEISCQNPISGFVAFLFVPVFTACLVLINHGELNQIPIMTAISMTGYVVNYFTHEKFKEDVQLNSTFGALTIGLVANLYSRLGKLIDEKLKNIWAMTSQFFSEANKDIPCIGSIEQSDEPKKPIYRLAAVVMLPAIFVQVPSGLSATGSLLSGLGAANEILHDSANITTVSASDVNSVALNFTFSVIRVAIGITVGLGLSELLVYPFGKKKSGIFSF